MSTIAQHLKLGAKQLFNQARATQAKLTKMIENGQMTSPFAQSAFNEAAAYEVAVQRLMFTEDFVDNELGEMDDDELTELILEREQTLIQQLMAAISPNMSQTDAQVAYGTKMALTIYSDATRKSAISRAARA